MQLAVAQTLCTAREIQVLEWWAAEVGIKRTAIVLGISESTVRTHRTRALNAIEVWLKSAGGCATVIGRV